MIKLAPCLGFILVDDGKARTAHDVANTQSITYQFDKGSFPSTKVALKQPDVGSVDLPDNLLCDVPQLFKSNRTIYRLFTDHTTFFEDRKIIGMIISSMLTPPC